ncbi:hypothetical protein M1843_02575 [Isoptericola sp. 4D.3]|uniref:Uncharacterized protein n=1 Tax=Isoptericola peretonis TaxID=2918523 RepID=A0ABT0IZF9_9MICO|nr:hypothetical protein [Isoptericola sp. 4D.3]
MKARSTWIVTGALGAVGLGAGVAAAQGTFDRAPSDEVVASAVQVGDDGTTTDSATATGPAGPSPAAVQNGTSITTVTAGSVATPSTAPTTQTAGTAASVQSAPTAQTAQTPASPVTASTPASPVTPQSAQTAQTAASAG